MKVVLYLHAGLKQRDFVGPLVCALKRVLVAPVSTREISLPFNRSMLATETQLDINKVAGQFIQASAGGASPTFKYLLLPYDMKPPSLNYAFASSYANPATPYYVGIVSTARLEASGPQPQGQQPANVTALRAYKLILKSIARLAGLNSPDRCILDFPRSLPELDQKSSEFCAEDREILVSAGILKAEEQESGDCTAVSDRRENRLFVLAAGKAHGADLFAMERDRHER